MDIYMTLKIQQKLNEKNWSHNELSRRTGLSKGAVSELMSGKKEPKLSTLCKIALALGCTLDELTEYYEIKKE